MHLAHPVYVKPFAKKHVKTDKVDARVLAQLLRMNYLPESYVPGKEIRDQRVMIRHHASLVRLRTSIKKGEDVNNAKHKFCTWLTELGAHTPEILTVRKVKAYAPRKYIIGIDARVFREI